MYTDIEQYNEGDDAAVMMTMHSAKGLEFPHVFLVGFEDGLFPGMRAIGDREEMEEERRLCYVAITRAKESLTISYAKQRMLYGRTNAALPSRFLKEIPQEDIVRKGSYRVAAETSFGRYGSFGSYDGYGDDYFAPKQKPQRSYLQEQIKRNETAKASAGPVIDLNKGDMVEHTAFGRGMVLSVMKMGGDALLEIAFDQIGTKKLMAKTATAHMKRLS